MDRAVATSTLEAYSVGWRHWCTFCSLAGIHTSSQEQQHFFWFVGYLRSVPSVKAYSTYKKYLSSIKAVHVSAGLPDPFLKKPTLARQIIGLKKLLGTKTKKKLPLTIGLLKRLKSAFNFNDKLDQVIWAILVIAVNGLFRLGELVCTSQNKGDVPRVASVSSPDINVRNIRLERSKTDPFANEVDVSVGSNSSKRLNAVRL